MLATSRLILRPFDETDLQAVFAYRGDPEVTRYLLSEPLDEEGARAFLARATAGRPGIPGGWFPLAITRAGEVIGDCGLRTDAKDPRLHELGFTLSRAHQGQGYATEAVRALLGYAFDTLGAHRVTASCDVRNTASVRVLERVGMRRETHALEDGWSKGEWTDSYGYAILAREWRGN